MGNSEEPSSPRGVIMIEHVRKAAQCLACREDTLAERLKLARSEVAIVMIQPDLVPDDLRPRLVEIAR